jgi:hypothetical protein
MVHEGSSPCSQQPAFGPYPEVHESNPHPKASVLKITININRPSISRSSG